jgi:hypothetical protein
MKTYREKNEDDNIQAAANSNNALQTLNTSESSLPFADNRQEAISQQKLQLIADNSIEAIQQKASHNILDSIPVQRISKGKVVQRNGIWDEVNVEFGSKPTFSPEEYAQGLTEDSGEFSELREQANEQMQDLYGTDLKYKPKPKKGGGTSEAYFKDDSVYFNMEGHPAMILANVIFETANAAQAGSFLQVENDYKSGAIMEKTPGDYGFDDLGKKLTGEYESGDAETRRAIIQERFEWRSFSLAKPTFLKVKKEMLKQEKSKDMYGVYFAAFDHMLGMKSFEEYYDEYGHTHRSAVEGVLRKLAEEEQSTCGCCYLTTACTEARGLPDDCEELTTLREFRDTYLINKENGSALIAAYYNHAPQILNAIRRRKDEEEILAYLYKIIRQCVDGIKKGDNEFAFRTYCRMVIELKERFLSEIEVQEETSI